MAKLNEAGIKAQLKNGEYSNAYLIYGEESYLKEYYVSQIKKKVVDPTFESFNFHQFEFGATSLDEILKDCQMLPMMSEYNLVVVKDYPITKSKEDLKLLQEYFKDIPESTIFAMVFDTVEFDLKKAAFKNLIKYFDDAGAVVKLDRRTEAEIIKLIVSGAKKRNAIISNDNARYLISYSGNDIQTLGNEINKLASFAQGGEITLDIINNMATKCLQAQVYDISRAIVAGNADKAFSVLNTLLDKKEDVLRINATISGVYIDMYRVKCAKTAGYSYDEVGKHFNYKNREFALKNASRDCAGLTEKQLRASLNAILEVDMKLKSTSVDQKLLMEEMIVKLIMIAGGIRCA